MICTLTFDHVVANIVVGITGPNVDCILDVPKGHNTSVDLEYLPKYEHNYKLFVQTSDLSIFNNPTEVTAIGFDKFFTFKSLLIYQGRNNYSDDYVDYCKTNHIDLDLTVNDNNLLFFTGSLDYTITHPAILNVHEKDL